MATSSYFRGRIAVRGRFSAFVAVLMTATGTDADIIKKEDMMRGIDTTRAQCDTTPQAVWVRVDAREICVRYYLSTAGGEGKRPLVFLQGDRVGTVDTKTWQWVPLDKDKKAGVTFDPDVMFRDVDTDDLTRAADVFSKMARTTAIYLARLGLDGTSGNHVFRHTLFELHLANAALDAIKQRYGFEGFHLAGQSGGSMLVTGLAALRHDVVCAVSGSGRLAFSGAANSKDPARIPIEPLQFIPAIARNRDLRFFVVTDSHDRSVPATQQTPFVEKMHRAGRDIPQYFVAATDDFHHGVVGYAELVAAGCVLGKSDSEIATAVVTMVKRNTAFNEMRRTEIAALAKTVTSPPKPLVDAGSTSAGRHPR
jgi:pimeloyl-ACP methyl ester carboxylesterase